MLKEWVLGALILGAVASLQVGALWLTIHTADRRAERRQRARVDREARRSRPARHEPRAGHGAGYSGPGAAPGRYEP